MCPETNQLSLDNFRYYAVNGRYSTIDDSEDGKELLSSINDQIACIGHDFFASKINGSLRYGNMLQIFIPKKLVDRCVYFSKRGGNPRKLPVPESLSEKFRTKILGQRFQKASTVLQALSNNSESVRGELTGLQARILLHKDLFDNPSSGIKIFRYNQIPQGLSDSYQSQLKSIAESVFALWKRTVVDPVIAQRDETIRELDDYIDQKKKLFTEISQRFLNEA